MQTNKNMISKIVKTVNNMYELDCTTDTRKREIVIPRQIAMYLVHKHLDVSLAVNGRHFKRDHATVIHALKCVKNIMESKSKYDEAFRKDIKEMDYYLKMELNLSKEEIKKLETREEIMEIIQEYNLLGLNNLKNNMVVMPN